MAHGSRSWVPAVVGLGMLAGTTCMAPPLWAATQQTGQPAAHKRSSEPAAKPSRHTKRISTKATQVRRRKGSDPAEPDGALAGEKAGGVRKHAARDPKKGSAAPTPHRVAKLSPAPKPPCTRDPIQFERGFGGESQSLVLSRCDGRPAPHAVEQLSILARPLSVAAPTVITTPVRHGPHQEWLPGVKVVSEGLVTRLQNLVDHFHANRIVVVSGYRPSSAASLHQSGRAIDFHIDGVTNQAVVAFCRTLADTGCGYYPNSSFIHMDVRPPHGGRVYWIDASGPGEQARYVASWPPREVGGKVPEIPRPDPAAPLDEQTHPDATPPLPPGASDAKIDATTTVPLAPQGTKDEVFNP